MNLKFDYYHNLEAVDLYLCNPDGRELFTVIGTNRRLKLRLNDLSELSFDVEATVTGQGGETLPLEAYDYLQTRRLIYATGIGWFVISNVVENDVGISKTKSVTCESLQATLKDRGFISEEKVYRFYNESDPKDNIYQSGVVSDAIPSVVGQLYQQLGILTDLKQGKNTPDVPYADWTITYINPDIKNMSRTFKDNTGYAYDWIVNDVEDAFEAIVQFDFLYKTIRVLSPSEVTVQGNIIFSFSNFMKDVKIEEKSKNIVTVMNCSGDNCEIGAVNPTGKNYICDFSYYMDKENHRWMSDELIEKLEAWQAAVTAAKSGYEKKCKICAPYIVKTPKLQNT